MKAILIVIVAAIAPVLAAAQGGFFGRGPQVGVNPEYDSRFVFTRMRYPNNSWSHDYPDADLYITQGLDDLTNVSVKQGRSNVFSFADPAMFMNPIIYVSEPGFWRLSDGEAANLRAYLLKGGFIIFDDFEGDAEWRNMAGQMLRALPDHRFIPIDVSHSIFHSLFDLKQLTLPHPSVAVTPVYYGMFLDNDPRGRMIALANHNSDIAEYWEFSAQDRFPVDVTSGAYELGINYVIYAMTH